MQLIGSTSHFKIFYPAQARSLTKPDAVWHNAIKHYCVTFVLNSIALVLKSGLDVVKMYLFTQNEVPDCSDSKVIA